MVEPQPEHVYLIVATYTDGTTETSMARFSHRENERAYWVAPFLTQGPAKVEIIRELAPTSEDVV
jgi:hypothetical protein